jgi:hypothetical protein
MKMSLPIRLVAIATCLSVSGAAADSDWQTVSLNGNPDFTIDLPTATTDYTPDPADAAEGMLMNFAIQTDDGGAFTCALNRVVNDKQYTPKIQRSFLKTTKRNALCSEDGATGLTIGGSEATTVDGLTAGDCVASYYKSNSDLHGWVMNPTMIVGTKSYYLLTCYYATDSQDEATARWVMTWHAKAQHIQQSLKIPANER